VPALNTHAVADLNSCIETHCCPVNSLSLRDAYRDVSARATHGAVAERVGERESTRITA